MKNEKNYTRVFLHSKFWSVSLEHFVEHKPLIYEECISNPTTIHFLDPMLLLMKHDTIDPTQDYCPIMFENSNQIMSYHPDLVMPFRRNLYSNLRELEYLRDFYDGKLSLRVSYPRSATFKSLSWRQTNNPLSSEDISGFESMNTDAM